MLFPLMRLARRMTSRALAAASPAVAASRRRPVAAPPLRVPLGAPARPLATRAVHRALPSSPFAIAARGAPPSPGPAMGNALEMATEWSSPDRASSSGAAWPRSARPVAAGARRRSGGAAGAPAARSGAKRRGARGDAASARDPVAFLTESGPAGPASGSLPAPSDAASAAPPGDAPASGGAGREMGAAPPATFSDTPADPTPDPDLGETAALRRARTHARPTAFVNVAGVTFEGRQRVVRSLRSGDPLLFVPEPDNPFDPGAIAVLTLDGASVGYVPRDCPVAFAARRKPGGDREEGEAPPPRAPAGITLGHVQSAGPARVDGPHAPASAPAAAPWGVVAACYPDVLAALPTELPLGLESLGEPLPAAGPDDSVSPSALPPCALSGAPGARARVPLWRCDDRARRLTLAGLAPVSVCLLSALRPAQEDERGGYDARVLDGEGGEGGEVGARAGDARPSLRETLVAELNGWRPEHAGRWLAAARRRAASRARQGPWRVRAADLRAVGLRRAPWGVEAIE